MMFGIEGFISHVSIGQIDDLQRGSVARRRSRSMCGHLGAIGVERFVSYLTGGYSEYFGQHGQRRVSPPVHEVPSVAESRLREAFFQLLQRHEQCQTTYLEMPMGLAQSGIDKWTVDTCRMTMAFYDKTGREMLVEQLS